MTNSIVALLFGAVGGAIASIWQYGVRRYSETQETRREVTETFLLQLQDAVESLYYRINNLLDHAGRSEMDSEYYRQTMAYIFARILAFESLFVANGIYAKLHSDRELKYDIKAGLHGLNSAMDSGGFHHYERVQLGEMAINENHVIGYTEFLRRWPEPQYAGAVGAAVSSIANVPRDELSRMRNQAADLVSLLSRKTTVPSALQLTGTSSSRARAVPSERMAASHDSSHDEGSRIA